MRKCVWPTVLRMTVWSGLIGIVVLAIALCLAAWSHFQVRVRAVSKIEEAGGYVHLTPSGPPWLRSLVEIDGVSITDRTESIEIVADDEGDLVEAIAACSGLEYLLLGSEDLTDEDLLRISRLRSLRGLELSAGGRVTDEGIARLGGLSELRQLSLHAPNLTTEGVRHLGTLTRLEKIELWGVGLSEDALRLLKTCRELRELTWNGRGVISDSGLETIAAAFPKLEVLDASNVPPRVTAPGLAALERLPALRVLRLGRVQLSGEQMRNLGALQSLEELSLKSATLAHEGFAHLGNLQRLRVLDLSGVDEVTDEAVAHLSSLQSLTHLDLTGARITDRCVDTLAQLGGLVALSLEYAELTDSGLKGLRPLSRLRRLNLAHTQVTDSGARMLRAQFPQIEAIDLYGTNVSPGLQEGLRYPPDYHRRFE